MSHAGPKSSDSVLPVRGRLAVAAALTFAAGVVHAAAAVPHFGDDTLLGAGFAVTGWVQILVAAFLLRRRPARGTVWAGVVTHFGALGALVAACTVGLPIGNGGVEPITLPNTTTAVLEVVAVVVLAGWLRRPRRLAMPRPVVLGTLGLAGLLAMGGSTVAIAALGTSGHGHTEAPVTAGAHDQEGRAHDRGTRDGDEHVTGSTEPGTYGEHVHVHDDDSVHVHGAGQGHVHDDGSVHVHLARQQPSQTASESHTHAPGEGHG